MIIIWTYVVMSTHLCTSVCTVWWSSRDFLIFLTLTLIINIPHDMWIVDNIFINIYTLDECTHGCITYFVTAHPEDGQARPKHVGATDWENIYHLCILLVFISNYTTMHGVETINIILCVNEQDNVLFLSG
jgi:hypothetical protein